MERGVMDRAALEVEWWGSARPLALLPWLCVRMVMVRQGDQEKPCWEEELMACRACQCPMATPWSSKAEGLSWDLERGNEEQEVATVEYDRKLPSSHRLWEITAQVNHPGPNLASQALL